MENENGINVEIDARGTILTVRANPGARRNGIVGVRNGALRVAVTAVPEKGKANRAVIEVLGDVLRVPKSSIQLLTGETAQQKRFLVIGAKPADVVRSLGEML
jgi:uncharacterized protein (TIGR00251 family)